MSTRLPWTDPVPDANLEARWKLEEGTGSAVADSSGNGRNGTGTSLAWAPGFRDSAGDFDGANTEVSIPDTNVFGVTNQMTIAAWVRRDSLGNIDTILSKYNSNAGKQSFILQVDTSNKLYSGYWTNASNVVLRTTDSAIVPANEWVHVASTLSGTTVSLYINGTLQASVDAGSAGTFTSIQNNDQAIRLGRMTDTSGDSASYTLDGKLEDVRVYSRALTAREVKSVYKTGINALKQDFTTGLVSRYRMNEGTGVTAADSVGANNGTLTGGATWLAGGREGAHAVDFDGVDGTVDMAAGVIPTGAKTVAFWVNTVQAGSGIIYANEGGSSSNWGSRVIANSSNLSFTVRKASPGVDNFEVAASPVNDGQWHHVACVWDGTTDADGAKVYIDGVQDAAATATTVSESAPSANLQLGYCPACPYFDGALDDFRAYNAALTEAQIRQVMRATQPPFGVINQIRGGGQ